MSSSFANQTLARSSSIPHGALSVGVYTLPKILDEKVARLQLKRFNAQLSTLTQEQADYIGVPVTARSRVKTTVTDSQSFAAGRTSRSVAIH